LDGDGTSDEEAAAGTADAARDDEHQGQVHDLVRSDSIRFIYFY